VMSLSTIVAFSLNWSQCCILSGSRSLHILISNDLILVVIRALDTLGSGNTRLSWLSIWVSLWTLIHIMSLFTTLKATPVRKGY
jgi:hypothetical protein